MKIDLAALTYDALDRMADEDPTRLRDIAWSAVEALRAHKAREDSRLAIAEATVERLRRELVVIRDIAYRADGAIGIEALGQIHYRAANAARVAEGIQPNA